MNTPKTFRTLLAAGPVPCVGAYDALSAHWIGQPDAKTQYVSGFAAADELNIVSQSEMAQHIWRIGDCTSLPVIAAANSLAHEAALGAQ